MLRTLALESLATKEANSEVSKVLQDGPPGQTTSLKRKYIVISPEQRAFIGKYAAENSNSAAVKKIKARFENGLVRCI